jgi:hypothetical protein
MNKKRHSLRMAMALNVSIRLPPPKYPLRLVIILLVSAIIAVILASIFGNERIIFVAKTVLFTIFLVCIPTVTGFISDIFLLYEKGKFIEAILQSVFTIAIIALFSIWLFGVSIFGAWVGVLFSMFLLFNIGGYLLRLYQDKIINRLSKSPQFEYSSRSIDELKESTRYQILFYVSTPFGLTSAIVYGWIRNLSELETLMTAVQVILVASSVILIVTLFVSAIIMSKSLILINPKMKYSEIETESNYSFWGRFITLLGLRPKPLFNVSKDYSKFYDMAYLVSDLRKVYFFDGVHSTILLLCFWVAFFSLSNSQIVVNNLLWIALSTLVVLFVFCYIPYATGQYNLHENILIIIGEEGIKRQEAKTELAKSSPLIPNLEFFTALLTTGSVGGVLSALAFELLKNALK